MSGNHPKELYIDDKWDKFIDISLRRVVYGSILGGAAALVLLSKYTDGLLPSDFPHSRAVCCALHLVLIDLIACRLSGAPAWVESLASF